MERNEQTHNTQTYNDLWEPFTGRPFSAKGSSQVRITFDRKGTLYLNKAAFAALGEARAVELLFSKKLGAIAIKPSDLRSESSFPIKPRRRYEGEVYGYLIQAAAFTQHHKLRPECMLQFNKINIMPNGMINLPLAYLTRVSRGAR
jgi:hypothetical protein